MGRSTIGMKILGGEPKKAAEMIGRRLAERFGKDQLHGLELMFNPEDPSELEIHGKWNGVDAARDGISGMKKEISGIEDAKIEIRDARVFTTRIDLI